MIDWIAPCGAFIFAALVALVWRQTLTLGKLAGISTRARDRERHDMHQLVLRLLEKRDTRDGVEMARLHKIERLEQARLDARVEENAERPPPKKPEVVDETCTPEDYEN